MTNNKNAENSNDKENKNSQNSENFQQDNLLLEFDQEQSNKSQETNASLKKQKSKNECLDEKSNSNSEEESSESDTEQINFPKENAQDLLQFISRDIVNLQNLEDGQKRKFALIRLFQIFVLSKNKAPNRIYQELLPEIQKQIFKRLSDKLEKCRELAILIIKEFFIRSDDISLSIPYFIPVLIERLNADDLEGVDYLDEKLKPSSNQKAQEIVQIVEKSEQVRLNIAETVTIMVSSTLFDCMRPYVDSFVNICKALCMDPYGDVIIEGTRAIAEFSKAGGDQLIHFCEPMGRSLFTAFVHKHAKVRIAGLRALFDVLMTGIWKNSVFVFEAMVGFRDPNIVPIKEFYDPSTKINYFAMFIQDRSIQVRQCFYKTMAKLLIDLPDRVDHEGRIFPYIISGLYDDNDDIKKLTFELIEEIGLQHEENNEEKFREIKQFGYVPEWMWSGIVKDEHIQLPFPLSHRPRFGSRILVKSYVRRYLKALYREIGDWMEGHQERAANLLMYSICYVEEFMTQYLDHLLVCMYKAILNLENKVIQKNLPYCFRLIGRYVNPKTYGPLIIQAITNQLASFYSYTQSGSLRGFGYLIAGSMELLQPGQNIGFLYDTLKSFVDAIQNQVIDSIDSETAHHLVETLDTIVIWLIKKQEEKIDISISQNFLSKFLDFSLSCLSAYQTFKLMKKPDPPLVIQQKQKCQQVIKDLSKLIKNKNDQNESFFDNQIVRVVDEQYVDLVEYIKIWIVEEDERDRIRAIEEIQWKEKQAKIQEEEAKIRRQKNKEAAKREQEFGEKFLDMQEKKAIEDEERKKRIEENGGVVEDQPIKVPKEWEEAFERSKQMQLNKQNETSYQEDSERPDQQQNLQLSQEKGKEMVQKSESDVQNQIIQCQKKSEKIVVDKITAIQNWAMQSPNWKLLNVILEIVDVQQLQYKCKNGESIFKNLSIILRIALWKPYSGPEYEKDESNLKKQTTHVKSYIMNYLLPAAINKSLPFLDAELSLIYLQLILKAMEIEGHLRDYSEEKIQHMHKIQSLHMNLIECKGIKFDSKYLDEYEKIYVSILNTFSKLKNEKLKQNGLRILKSHMIEFYKQVLAPLNEIKQKEQILQSNQFMGKISQQILVDLGDYFETVREEAQQLMLVMAQRFLPPQIMMNQDQVDMVQLLKSNLGQGWPQQLTSQLKEAAILENESLKYLFQDSISFISKTIQIFIDETYGRENYIQFFKLISVATPFLLMNDYRQSKQNNSLKRIEVLENILREI